MLVAQLHQLAHARGQRRLAARRELQAPQQLVRALRIVISSARVSCWLPSTSPSIVTISACSRMPAMPR
jgi:hypothetical protein